MTETNALRTLFLVKKDYFLIVPVCIYEFFRCIYIFIGRPEQYIEILPLSWYTGIFSLILPLVFAFFAFRKDDSTFSWVYAVIKLGQDIGIGKYLYDDWPFVLSNGYKNQYYSYNRIFSLVSFLVIDAILIAVLFIYQKKRKDSNADNSSCER